MQQTKASRRFLGFAVVVLTVALMAGTALAGGFPALKEVLGIEKEELLARRQAGESLAEIAAGQGVAADDLIAALTAAHAQRLAEMVASGRLSQEQADAHAAVMTERLQEMVHLSEMAGPHKQGMRFRHGEAKRFRHGEGMGPMEWKQGMARGHGGLMGGSHSCPGAAE